MHRHFACSAFSRGTVVVAARTTVAKLIGAAQRAQGDYYRLSRGSQIGAAEGNRCRARGELTGDGAPAAATRHRVCVRQHTRTTESKKSSSKLLCAIADDPTTSKRKDNRGYLRARRD